MEQSPVNTIPLQQEIAQANASASESANTTSIQQEVVQASAPNVCATTPEDGKMRECLIEIIKGFGLSSLKDDINEIKEMKSDLQDLKKLHKDIADLKSSLSFTVETCNKAMDIAKGSDERSISLEIKG